MAAFFQKSAASHLPRENCNGYVTSPRLKCGWRVSIPRFRFPGSRPAICRLVARTGQETNGSEAARPVFACFFCVMPGFTIWGRSQTRTRTHTSFPPSTHTNTHAHSHVHIHTQFFLLRFLFSRELLALLNAIQRGSADSSPSNLR